MYNVFEIQEDKEIRNAQIVYLREELKMSFQEIKKYVNLAVNTIKNYCYKFIGLLDKARRIFGKVAIPQMPRAKEKQIINETNQELKNGECAYIIEYYNNEGKFLWLKVGKTKHINDRVKQHFREYKRDKATIARIKQVFYSKENNANDALTIENLLRKHYQAITNNGFIPQDRFELIHYDNQELESDTLTMQVIQMFA